MQKTWYRFVAVFLTFLSAALATTPAHAEPPVGSKLTPLDHYVAKPDDAYRWELRETIDAPGFKTHAIRLTSQRWRTEADVDKPLWEHWLAVTVPDKVQTDRVFLFIGGGSHTSAQPKAPDAVVAAIAAATGSVVAELKNIPNQPLVFHNDGEARSEDDLIGYAWAQF
ncbi:MAG: PhoPQ-activated protein PqaA family protein, partial [Pirellula sp.]